jgi:hypothetical protein
MGPAIPDVSRGGLLDSLTGAPPPDVPGYTAVGFIHTHPFIPLGQSFGVTPQSILAYPQPSKADVATAFRNGVEGVVVSHVGNFDFGPPPSVKITPRVVSP